MDDVHADISGLRSSLRRSRGPGAIVLGCVALCEGRGEGGVGRGGLVLHFVTEIDFSSSLGRYMYSLELWASGGKKIFC